MAVVENLAVLFGSANFLGIPPDQRLSCNPRRSSASMLWGVQLIKNMSGKRGAWKK
jgi:hypothetical protein